MNDLYSLMLEQKRLEAPFLVPNGSVDWIQMSTVMGAERWREYVIMSRAIRLATRRK